MIKILLVVVRAGISSMEINIEILYINRTFQRSIIYSYIANELSFLKLVFEISYIELALSYRNSRLFLSKIAAEERVLKRG